MPSSPPPPVAHALLDGDVPEEQALQALEAMMQLLRQRQHAVSGRGQQRDVRGARAVHAGHKRRHRVHDVAQQALRFEPRPLWQPVRPVEQVKLVLERVDLRRQPRNLRRGLGGTGR